MKNIDNENKIVIKGASEQSRRDVVPEISNSMNFTDLLKIPCEHKVIAYEGLARSSETFVKYLNENKDFEDLINSTKGILTVPDYSIFANECEEHKEWLFESIAEKKLDIIIIDYLQLMSGNGKSESRTQEVSEISRSLKGLARELNIPVVALSQLSRAVEQRPDHRPMLSDLRESGSIEQDADMVIFLYRDDYYNENTETPGVCEVNIAKHRSGPTGKVDLTWVSMYTKFSDQAL